jgi:hypothetical protein
MKLDAYTKTLLAVIVVCLVILCVAQMRLAAAAQKAVAWNEAEAEKRKAFEVEMAKTLTPKKRRATPGFTGMPFATA